MKNIAAFGFIFIAALTLPTHACEPTSDQLKDWFARSRTREETYLVDLARESDEIFTGTVTHVDILPDGP